MELALVLALVAGAALYLGVRAWRTFRPRRGAAGGCGCASTKAGCPAASGTARRIRRAAAARAGASPRP
jgi:hypothetical protein